MIVEIGELHEGANRALRDVLSCCKRVMNKMQDEIKEIDMLKEE